MSGLPYEDARAGDRALAECQKILSKFGCSQFGTMVDQERGVTLVQFKYREQQISLEASWKGYAAAWLKRHPHPGNRYNAPTSGQWQVKALEIGKVAVCSILRDWLKGQVTAVECGVMSFEAVFFAHMLLPSGERLIDRVQGAYLPKAQDNVVQVEFKP
jgi:hypothetical protein